MMPGVDNTTRRALAWAWDGTRSVTRAPGLLPVWILSSALSWLPLLIAPPSAEPGLFEWTNLGIMLSFQVMACILSWTLHPSTARPTGARQETPVLCIVARGLGVAAALWGLLAISTAAYILGVKLLGQLTYLDPFAERQVSLLPGYGDLVLRTGLLCLILTPWAQGLARAPSRILAGLGLVALMLISRITPSVTLAHDAIRPLFAFLPALNSLDALSPEVTTRWTTACYAICHASMVWALLCLLHSVGLGRSTVATIAARDH